MRDIKEIYSDLVDAEKEVNDECAEIEFHIINRDDAQSYVDQYTKELEDAKLNKGQMMKSIFIGFLLAATVLGNLFFTFYLGSKFVDANEWHLIPTLVSLFIWFMFIALACVGIGDKLLNKG